MIKKIPFLFFQMTIFLFSIFIIYKYFISFPSLNEISLGLIKNENYHSPFDTEALAKLDYQMFDNQEISFELIDNTKKMKPQENLLKNKFFSLEEKNKITYLKIFLTLDSFSFFEVPIKMLNTDQLFSIKSEDIYSYKAYFQSIQNTISENHLRVKCTDNFQKNHIFEVSHSKKVTTFHFSGLPQGEKITRLTCSLDSSKPEESILLFLGFGQNINKPKLTANLFIISDYLPIYQQIKKTLNEKFSTNHAAFNDKILPTHQNIFKEFLNLFIPNELNDVLNVVDKKTSIPFLHKSCQFSPFNKNELLPKENNVRNEVCYIFQKELCFFQEFNDCTEGTRMGFPYVKRLVIKQSEFSNTKLSSLIELYLKETEGITAVFFPNMQFEKKSLNFYSSNILNPLSLIFKKILNHVYESEEKISSFFSQTIRAIPFDSIFVYYHQTFENLSLTKPTPLTQFSSLSVFSQTALSLPQQPFSFTSLFNLLPKAFPFLFSENILLSGAIKNIQMSEIFQTDTHEWFLISSDQKNTQKIDLIENEKMKDDSKEKNFYFYPSPLSITLKDHLPEYFAKKNMSSLFAIAFQMPLPQDSRQKTVALQFSSKRPILGCYSSGQIMNSQIYYEKIIQSYIADLKVKMNKGTNWQGQCVFAGPLSAAAVTVVSASFNGNLITPERFFLGEYMISPLSEMIKEGQVSFTSQTDFQILNSFSSPMTSSLSPEMRVNLWRPLFLHHTQFESFNLPGIPFEPVGEPKLGFQLNFSEKGEQTRDSEP